MLSSACQQLRLLSMFVASYRLSKQKNTNTLTVLNRKRENKKEKYVIVFQLMKIFAKIKIRVKIQRQPLSFYGTLRKKGKESMRPK